MTRPKRAEAKTIARRKAMGVRKEDLKRGLSEPAMKGTAASPPPSVAVAGGERKPPETLEEFKVAYEEARRRGDYWVERASANDAELRRLRALLKAAADALWMADRDPEIPF